MQAGHKVYLDATMLGERFPVRFPTIFRLCQERGLDPRHQQIPVAPSAHFIMGGIQADTDGRTSIPGLFACGEVACTGVHGANRLASNSLLEGLVFAERVAQTLPTEVVPSGVSGAGAGGGEGASDGPISLQLSVPKPGTNSEELANNVATQVRNIMWNYAGIVRTGEGLDKARQELETLMASEASRLYPVANLLETAMLIVQSAYARQESRGGHYRSDYPTENDEWAVRHVITSHNGCTVMQNGALARVNS
jgi:L-aspartate oxidase